MIYNAFVCSAVCIVGCLSQDLQRHILNFCYHNCPVFNLIGEKFPEFTCKHVSDMYYSAELESEIRHTNHPERIEWKFQRDEDRDCYLTMLLSEFSTQVKEQNRTSTHSSSVLHVALQFYTQHFRCSLCDNTEVGYAKY